MTAVSPVGVAAADSRLWHPFADMSKVSGHEVVIERGEGIWLWTAAGDRLLDASASLWYANLGHGRREIAAAVAEQLERLEAYSIFGDLTNPPASALADRLAALAPMDDARVFLTTGGGEAIDTAAKIARRYWDVTGEPRRQHLIGRIGGYHGSNGFGTSIGGIEDNRVGFGALIPHTSYVEYDSVSALEREIERVGAENTAAFFMEPVMGAGGVRLPPDGYVEAVADLCDSLGILLVADSVICGFGRLGSWFGIERWGVRPDLITFAKGVSGGYMPVGGVVASWRVAEPFWTEPGAMLRHGPTYSGHAACAAAALCALDIYEREELIGRGAELEQPLADALAGLASHPLVAEVRAGIGLMAAVELISPALTPHVYAAMRDHGVLGRAQGSGIAVSPPLTIEPAQLGLIADAFGAALEAVASAV
jgi:adenosylmethionine-8-amino-7-oxononanoate aminotransferase